MLSEKYEKYIIYDQPLPEADKDISPQVLESWKRSKNFQLPWQKLKSLIVPGSAGYSFQKPVFA
jgi:hypothetical protein